MAGADLLNDPSVVTTLGAAGVESSLPLLETREDEADAEGVVHSIHHRGHGHHLQSPHASFSDEDGKGDSGGNDGNHPPKSLSQYHPHLDGTVDFRDWQHEKDNHPNVPFCHSKHHPTTSPESYSKCRLVCHPQQDHHHRQSSLHHQRHDVPLHTKSAPLVPCEVTVKNQLNGGVIDTVFSLNSSKGVSSDGDDGNNKSHGNCVRRCDTDIARELASSSSSQSWSDVAQTSPLSSRHPKHLTLALSSVSASSHMCISRRKKRPGNDAIGTEHGDNDVGASSCVSQSNTRSPDSVSHNDGETNDGNRNDDQASCLPHMHRWNELDVNNQNACESLCGYKDSSRSTQISSLSDSLSSENLHPSTLVDRPYAVDEQHRHTIVTYNPGPIDMHSKNSVTDAEISMNVHPVEDMPPSVPLEAPLSAAVARVDSGSPPRVELPLESAQSQCQSRVKYSYYHVDPSTDPQSSSSTSPTLMSAAHFPSSISIPPSASSPSPSSTSSSSCSLPSSTFCSTVSRMSGRLRRPSQRLINSLDTSSDQSSFVQVSPRNASATLSTASTPNSSFPNSLVTQSTPSHESQSISHLWTSSAVPPVASTNVSLNFPTDSHPLPSPPLCSSQSILPSISRSENAASASSLSSFLCTAKACQLTTSSVSPGEQQNICLATASAKGSSSPDITSNSGFVTEDTDNFHDSTPSSREKRVKRRRRKIGIIHEMGSKPAMDCSLAPSEAPSTSTVLCPPQQSHKSQFRNIPSTRGIASLFPEPPSLPLASSKSQSPTVFSDTKEGKTYSCTEAPFYDSNVVTAQSLSTSLQSSLPTKSILTSKKKNQSNSSVRSRRMRSFHRSVADVANLASNCLSTSLSPDTVHHASQSVPENDSSAIHTDADPNSAVDLTENPGVSPVLSLSSIPSSSSSKPVMPSQSPFSLTSLAHPSFQRRKENSDHPTQLPKSGGSTSSLSTTTASINSSHSHNDMDEQRRSSMADRLNATGTTIVDQIECGPGSSELSDSHLVEVDVGGTDVSGNVSSRITSNCHRRKSEKKSRGNVASRISGNVGGHVGKGTCSGSSGRGSSGGSSNGGGNNGSISTSSRTQPCLILGYDNEMPVGEIQAVNRLGLMSLGGGTCFLNVIIQFLSHSPPFRDFYLNFEKNLPKKKSLGRFFDAYVCELSHQQNNHLPSRMRRRFIRNYRPGSSITWEVAVVINHMWRCKKGVRYLKPEGLFNACLQIMPHFDPRQMQDCDEFLRHLLDILDAELCSSEEDKRTDGQSNRRAIKSVVADYAKTKMPLSSLLVSQQRLGAHVRTHISVLFEGLERDELVCGRCGRRTLRFVPFKSLVVAMTPEAQQQACYYAGIRAKPSMFLDELAMVDIIECLNLHFGEDRESLTASSGEGYHCPRCQSKQDAIKNISLVREHLPFILCLSLKRFVRGRDTFKIWNPVYFEEFLDFSQYVYQSAGTKDEEEGSNVDDDDVMPDKEGVNKSACVGSDACEKDPKNSAEEQRLELNMAGNENGGILTGEKAVCLSRESVVSGDQVHSVEEDSDDDRRDSSRVDEGAIMAEVRRKTMSTLSSIGGYTAEVVRELMTATEDAELQERLDQETGRAGVDAKRGAGYGGSADGCNAPQRVEADVKVKQDSREQGSALRAEGGGGPKSAPSLVQPNPPPTPPSDVAPSATARLEGSSTDTFAPPLGSPHCLSPREESESLPVPSDDDVKGTRVDESHNKNVSNGDERHYGSVGNNASLDEGASNTTDSVGVCPSNSHHPPPSPTASSSYLPNGSSVPSTQPSSPSPPTKSSCSTGDALYQLIAVVQHEGPATDQGHYICYTRHAHTGDWLKADDREVHEVDFQTVLRALPYLLIYRKASPEAMASLSLPSFGQTDGELNDDDDQSDKDERTEKDLSRNGTGGEDSKRGTGSMENSGCGSGRKRVGGGMKEGCGGNLGGGGRRQRKEQSMKGTQRHRPSRGTDHQHYHKQYDHKHHDYECHSRHYGPSSSTTSFLSPVSPAQRLCFPFGSTIGAQISTAFAGEGYNGNGYPVEKSVDREIVNSTDGTRVTHTTLLSGAVDCQTYGSAPGYSEDGESITLSGPHAKQMISDPPKISSSATNERAQRVKAKVARILINSQMGKPWKRKCIIGNEVFAAFMSNSPSYPENDSSHQESVAKSPGRCGCGNLPATDHGDDALRDTQCNVEVNLEKGTGRMIHGIKPLPVDCSSIARVRDKNAAGVIAVKERRQKRKRIASEVEKGVNFDDDGSPSTKRDRASQKVESDWKNRRLLQSGDANSDVYIGGIVDTVELQEDKYIDDADAIPSEARIPNYVPPEIMGAGTGHGDHKSLRTTGDRPEPVSKSSGGRYTNSHSRTPSNARRGNVVSKSGGRKRPSCRRTESFGASSFIIGSNSIEEASANTISRTNWVAGVGGDSRQKKRLEKKKSSVDCPSNCDPPGRFATPPMTTTTFPLTQIETEQHRNEDHNIDDCQGKTLLRNHCPIERLKGSTGGEGKYRHDQLSPEVAESLFPKSTLPSSLTEHSSCLSESSQGGTDELPSTSASALSLIASTSLASPATSILQEIVREKDRDVESISFFPPSTELVGHWDRPSSTPSMSSSLSISSSASSPLPAAALDPPSDTLSAFPSFSLPPSTSLATIPLTKADNIFSCLDSRSPKGMHEIGVEPVTVEHERREEDGMDKKSVVHEVISGSLTKTRILPQIKKPARRSINLLPSSTMSPTATVSIDRQSGFALPATSQHFQVPLISIPAGGSPENFISRLSPRRSVLPTVSSSSSVSPSSYRYGAFNPSKQASIHDQREDRVEDEKVLGASDVFSPISSEDD